MLSVWGVLISFWSVSVFSPTLHSLLLLLPYYYCHYCHYTVFSRDFEVVSQYCKVAGGCMMSARRARAPRGVRGHAPPENFLKIGPWRCNLRHFEHSVAGKTV